MAGDMEDQEWRYAFVFGHMCDGGEVAMFRRIVAELLTMAELRARQVMRLPAGLGRLDDRRHVIGVAIDRHASPGDGQGQALRLQVAVVGADRRGQLRPGRVAHDEQALRVAPVLGDVVMHPADGPGDIAHDGRHVHARQESVVGGDKDEPFVHENLRLHLDARFVARLPTAAVNPEDHRQIFRIMR